MRTCAIGFQCEKGRNGVLCLHEILLLLKSECSEEINSNGSHIIKYTFKDLESIYAFTKEHYNDWIPAGAGVSERKDKLESDENR